MYERAIANVPPAPEKRYWQRYIYLWIKYALWEELEAEDADRARQVYRACLNLIPHSIFTFAKVRSARQVILMQMVMKSPSNATESSAVVYSSPFLSFT